MKKTLAFVLAAAMCLGLAACGPKDPAPTTSTPPTSALTPIYCGTTEVPFCFSEENGSMLEYSDSSAFWIFNRVAQFAYLRYDVIGRAVRESADAWEEEMLGKVKRFDEKVMREEMSHKRMVREATRFSVENAQRLFDRWVALDRYLKIGRASCRERVSSPV